MRATSMEEFLHDLGAYGARCVKNGGINPRNDVHWQGLARRLVSAHNRWAQPLKFPLVSKEPNNRRDLIPWLRRQALNGRDSTWLASVLCHIDVARSLDFWTDDVFEPLDPWWPQDPGPRFVKVPAAAWDIVSDKEVNPEWILQPLAELLFVGMPDGERNRKNPLNLDHEDTLRLLPGLLVARWTSVNFLSHSHRLDLQQKIELLIQLNRGAASDLEGGESSELDGETIWDDEKLH